MQQNTKYRVTQLSWRPRAFIYRNFLTDEECDHLIALYALRLVYVAIGVGVAAFIDGICWTRTAERDTDLHVAALALNLCSTMLADRNSTTKVGLTVRNKVFSQVITLVRRSLLQEQVLMAMQSFFAVLIHSADTSFDDLLGPLISIDVPFFKSGGSFSKQALLSSAQRVAVLCLAAGDHKCSFTVKMLAAMLTTDSNAYSENQHLSLLCLGEIGRMKDLSSHANIENIVSGYFQSPFEEINSAASYALGNIAVGNISRIQEDGGEIVQACSLASRFFTFGERETGG
ncbi:hypothetical protein POM88_025423 [Heracleum sosnowskyi]|uniref:ARM repeat superfamily protein n=1 Tax=Heracleum sosnowskyi TaxID=360622 RepID=A0AAD8MN56_9APIA|nr:hypothetical protein POM88_025423 [Heracleum sosnowskyi]